MTFHKTLLSAGLVLLVSTSCGTRDEPEPAPSLQLEPCRLKGYDQEISCARFEVFEDRKARTGRRILLNIAVIRAASGNPAPDPFFILAGGPGQAATSYVPWVRSVFKKVHFDRDIVLVDQRGTGKSNPLCEWESETGSDLMFDSLSSEKLRSCLSEWDADVRFYSNFEAMGDLDEIRRALGYEENKPLGRFLRHTRCPGLHANAARPCPNRHPRWRGSLRPEIPLSMLPEIPSAR